MWGISELGAWHVVRISLPWREGSIKGRHANGEATGDQAARPLKPAKRESARSPSFARPRILRLCDPSLTEQTPSVLNGSVLARKFLSPTFYVCMRVVYVGFVLLMKYRGTANRSWSGRQVSQAIKVCALMQPYCCSSSPGVPVWCHLFELKLC